jgi:hypothetical protein
LQLAAAQTQEVVHEMTPKGENLKKRFCLQLACTSTTLKSHTFCGGVLFGCNFHDVAAFLDSANALKQQEFLASMKQQQAIS